MHVIVGVLALFLALAGLAFSSQLTVGVSITVIAAALWIGSAVDRAGELIIKAIKDRSQ